VIGAVHHPHWDGELASWVHVDTAWAHWRCPCRLPNSLSHSPMAPQRGPRRAIVGPRDLHTRSRAGRHDGRHSAQAGLTGMPVVDYYPPRRSGLPDHKEPIAPGGSQGFWMDGIAKALVWARLVGDLVVTVALLMLADTPRRDRQGAPESAKRPAQGPRGLDRPQPIPVLERLEGPRPPSPSLEVVPATWL